MLLHYIQVVLAFYVSLSVNGLSVDGNQGIFSLALPVVSYFVPVGYIGDVEQHIPSKYCRAWRGFEYRMVGRANGPCRIG